jgi:hypothetical protein
MRRLSVLAIGGFLAMGCSAAPSGGPSSTGESGSASTTPQGGSSSGSNGSSGAGSTSTGGSSGTTSGGTATTTTGGGADAGSDATVDSGHGGSSDAGDSGVVSARSIVCNSVLGIDSTSEWFTSGFENQVPNAKWQIIFHHPGYVQNWGNATDPVWSTAITSACTTNSTNPDRVIFNAFADPADTTFGNATAWATGLTKVIENLKTKFPGVKRIDLLAMTRGPGNMPCVTGNRMDVVETWVDTAMSQVAAAYPGLVTVSPSFFAPNCDVFQDGGPHFTDAGKPIIAKLYGDYYSTEP